MIDTNIVIFTNINPLPRYEQSAVAAALVTVFKQIDKMRGKKRSDLDNEEKSSE